MKNFIYSLITFLIFNFSYAQNNLSELAWSNSAIADYSQPTNSTDLLIAVKQSQLFDLNWEKAEIKVNENTQIVEARYNPFIDAIEIKQDDKIFEFAKVINRNIKFIDTNINYQAKSFYGSDGKIYTSFFILNGIANDIILLKKEWFEINKSYQNPGQKYPSVATVTEQFKKRDYYYFIDDNNRLFNLTTDRRYIKKMFPDNAKSIIHFITANKLNSDNENDIITLATYINTLKIESKGI